MLETFLTSFTKLLDPQVMLFMMIGIVIGMAVGILPGLGSTVTMALMLPFIYSMTPFQAFAFLLGMYSVCATTGDITSVLVGVPGEAVSAALVVDGYAMTKNGEAGRALGAAVFSSAIGALIGAVFLAISIPVIRPAVLQLGQPELFMLAVVGLSMVGVLSGRSLLKGIIAGGFGLLLSAVGTESQVGIIRYAGDNLYLLDGLPLIPIAVGLFGLPELIDLHCKRTAIARQGRVTGATTLQGVKDTFTHWALVVRCSLIGVILGVIPGVGGGLSQWLAYGHAVQSSKDPSRFGKGAIEGVLGPGASNNSKEGGHLIPTVAFGVPGSSAMAILLAAFVIMGIQPGPNMLTRNLDLTFFLVWVLVVANLLGVALSFIFLNQLAKITFVRGALLVPFITLLIFLGSMSATGQVGDLVVTLFFGALAWTMHKFGWPVVPLILGLVLGDRAENSLWISTRIFGFSWLGRPIVIGLIILAAAVVIFTLTRMRKGVEMDAEEESPGLPLARLIFSLCAFGLAIGAVVMALEWPVAARLFPVAIGSVTAVVAFFQVVADLMHFLKKRGVPVRQEGPEERALSRVMNRRTAEIFGWMVGLFAAIWAVGFTFLVAPFLLLYLKLSAQERWKTVLIAAGVTGLIYWAFFDQFLNVPTPSGAIIRW
jgi:putative tricarboxylic transport membrane protein